MNGRSPSFGELLLDNPILIKHVRARLRRGAVLGALSIVGSLGLLIVWFSILTGGFATGTAFGLVSALQGIVLTIIGTTQVANSLAKARESNILDFHRISPLPPLVVTLGFFFGAPILEYLIFASLVPLAALAALHQESPVGFANLLRVTAAQVLVAWVFHGLALLSALMIKKPKGNPAGGIFALMFIVFLFGTGGLFGAVQRLDRNPELPFFGRDLPWLTFMAVYLGAILAFLLIASARKMKSERMHSLSKPQGLSFVATAAVLILGAFWGTGDRGEAVMIALYGLILAGMVASVTMMPTASEYAKGLRRAERSGRRHLPPWDDLSLNRIGVASVALIVLCGSTIASQFLTGYRGLGFGNEGSFGLAIAIGVLVVAYFGLGFQFFSLVSTKHGGTLMALFLFFAWVVPMLAGAICAAADLGQTATIGTLALSPIPGLGMAAGGAPAGQVQTAQIAALLPAIAFFFLFNNLVTARRRRVEREVQAVGSPAKGSPLAARPDPLAVG